MLYDMRVPGLHPDRELAVESSEEKMMEKPDVSCVVVVEAVERLQQHEKLMPLVAQPQRQVQPYPFNAGVMYAPDRCSAD